MASQVSDNHTVTPVQARSAINACIDLQLSMFLWGPPGIGKSDIVKSIASDLGGIAIDVRMSQMEPTDIRGIPYFDKVTVTQVIDPITGELVEKAGGMDWAPPVCLPNQKLADKYPVIILFFDEMNSASPSVQAAAYQLILDRRIGNYKLPENVAIVAAGNRDSDKGVTYRMPMPLANRFVHVEMRPDFASWQDWAIRDGVHKDVVGYLSFAKQDLYDFDPKSSSKAFATPRSWSYVSKILKKSSLDETTLFTLIAGAVGEGLAAKFKAHRKFVGKMPEPADILSGKVTTLDTKEISAMYALTTGMCYELKAASEDKTVTKDDLVKMMDNFIGFMMANFETELVVMGARIALKVYKLPFPPTGMSNFDPFFKKFGKFIVENA